MVVSTPTVVSPPTLSQSSASQPASTGELMSCKKPVVTPMRTILPLILTRTSTSSTVESSILLGPISSLTLATWTSTVPSAANKTSVISSSTVKTSSALNLSSAVSSTITESSSSMPFVSSQTISEPESTWSIVEPVTSSSSFTTWGTMGSAISSTVVPTSKPASILINSALKLVPSEVFSEAITTTDLSALASSAGFIGAVTEISSTPTPTQSPSGRVYSGMASIGGWNKTSSMIFESLSLRVHTSFTIGTLTTLSAAAGFKNSNQPSAHFPSSTGSTFFPASLTPSADPLTGTTSIFKVVSLSSMIPLYSATWTTKTSSLSVPSTMSTPFPIFNATSLPVSTSMSSVSISKTTSMFHSTRLTTSASISGFIPTIVGPSSVAFPNSTSVTSTSMSPLSTSSNCGEQGDFVLNPEPLFNPYRQFLFSDGFTVVPPPKRLPFLPSSSPLLLEFIPNFDANSSNKETGPNAADQGFSGQIGSGDEGFTGCFTFNLYGASLGCDSRDAACGFTFTGYSYDVASKKTSKVAQQVINVPACPELSNCVLTSVELDSSFRDLTYFLMNVTVAGEPKLWWTDDLRLGWFDNSCSMGFCRQKTHLRR
ncbi:hypothetical protein SS1G_11110 [Sclerotinia sclerotiorum 1980 UF-70]|nr:hypothetical protein SS1G_11110 [Sclerotinia sclerotiorum 1980 UF-70]EDN95234.1 hypothetical protein SS1G_11110 [Sclerotinia sclerotiorum 1980 UF-70]